MAGPANISRRPRRICQLQQKREKIKAACIEVANIVNDWRTEIVGGLETAMI